MFELILDNLWKCNGKRDKAHPDFSLSVFWSVSLSGCNFVVICEYNNDNNSHCCLCAVHLINWICSWHLTPKSTLYNIYVLKTHLLLCDGSLKIPEKILLLRVYEEMKTTNGGDSRYDNTHILLIFMAHSYSLCFQPRS